MRLSWIAVALVWPGVAATVEFNRDIRPIFSDKCYTCHGPDKANRKSKLRFDTEAGATAELGGHFAIVAGDPVKSEMVRRITADNKALRMPPVYSGVKLTDREIELIRQWVAQGAVWEKHWSFIPPKRRETPQVSKPQWVRNPIDAFVLERLEREGLAPSAEADRATLIRRVTLDLTGLPPTPAEVDAFVRDGDYEKVVDRLLASPRYGERMAVRWLDAARYADTNGYQTDGERCMWRWRDWVIDAFNRNMPFDQFTIEQIAGDMLPNATLDQKIATGFNRNHRGNGEGGIVPEEYAVEYVVDRVDTTSTVWLGLTVGCARCHDHKYDPILAERVLPALRLLQQRPRAGHGVQIRQLAAVHPGADAASSRRNCAELDEKIAAAAGEVRANLNIANGAAGVGKARSAPASCRWQIPDGSGSRSTAPATFDGKELCRRRQGRRVRFLRQFTLAAWINPSAPNGAILSTAEDVDRRQRLWAVPEGWQSRRRPWSIAGWMTALRVETDQRRFR